MCSRHAWCCWASWPSTSTAQFWLAVLEKSWRLPIMDRVLILTSKNNTTVFGLIWSEERRRVYLRWWKCQRNCVKWFQNTSKDVENFHDHMNNLMFFPQVLILTHESGIPSGPCRWAGHWCGWPWTAWTKLKSSGTSLAEQKNTPSGEWRPVWPSYKASKHLKFICIRHKSRQMVQWDGPSTMLMQAGWVVKSI